MYGQEPVMAFPQIQLQPVVNMENPQLGKNI